MATNGIDGERIPLMLIHGAWLSARSWENFADYFEKRGYAVSAPEWPRKHGDVEGFARTATTSPVSASTRSSTITRRLSALSAGRPS